MAGRAPLLPWNFCLCLPSLRAIPPGSNRQHSPALPALFSTSTENSARPKSSFTFLTPARQCKKYFRFFSKFGQKIQTICITPPPTPVEHFFWGRKGTGGIPSGCLLLGYRAHKCTSVTVISPLFILLSNYTTYKWAGTEQNTQGWQCNNWNIIIKNPNYIKFRPGDKWIALWSISSKVFPGKSSVMS